MRRNDSGCCRCRCRCHWSLSCLIMCLVFRLCHGLISILPSSHASINRLPPSRLEPLVIPRIKYERFHVLGKQHADAGVLSCLACLTFTFSCLCKVLFFLSSPTQISPCPSMPSTDFLSQVIGTTRHVTNHQDKTTQHKTRHHERQDTTTQDKTHHEKTRQDRRDKKR